MLAADPEIYPEGLITGYYGELTVKAVQKFQCKYNIVCAGAPETTGYGLAGPITREKLNELYAAEIQTPINQTNQALFEEIQKQIKVLQQKLVDLLTQLVDLLSKKLGEIK